MQAEQEFLPANLTEIKPFSKLESQLAAMRESNDKAVFDYSDPKGNKEARSHVHTFRKFRGELERTRKSAKQEALDYGRMIDAEAKRIDGLLDAMIEVHEKPLLEIEAKETARKVAIMNRMELLDTYKQIPMDAKADVWADELDAVLSFPIDVTLAEYMAAAAIAKDAALTFIRGQLALAQTREAEAAELKRLREAEEARQRQEREERIAREAAERATKEAEAKAEREKQAAERAAKEKEQALIAEQNQKEAIAREAVRQQEAAAAESERKAAKAIADAKLAQEQAEKRAKDAAEEAKLKADKALREAEAAVQVERKRALDAVADAERKVKEKALAEQAAAEKREANKRHAAKINNEAVNALILAGLSQDHAKAAVTAIAQGKVPHVSISY